MKIISHYILDPDLKIIEVGGAWDQFAAENEGRELGFERVHDRSIFEFVTGDNTRLWLEALLQLARIRQEPVARPYRCDSPLIQRHMEMRVIPLEGGLLKVEHDLIETRDRSVRVELEAAGPGSVRSPVMRCSVCGKIRQEGAWVEADEGVTDGSVRFLVAYTVCPLCNTRAPWRS
jgi:hypothetical protein